MEKKYFIPPELSTPSPEFSDASKRIGLYWWYWQEGEELLSLSPEYLKLLGLSKDDLDPTKPAFYANIHPDDIEPNLEKFKQVVYGEQEMYEMEFRVRDQKGEWQWYYNRGVAVDRDENGRATLIGGISLDISGKFKQLITQLGEREKFEFLFRNSDDAMVVFDMHEDGKILVADINEAGMKLFKQTEEVIGGRMPKENIDDPVIGEKGSLFREALEKGSSRMEHKYIMPGGEERWLGFSAHRFDHGGKRQVMGIVKDLTKGKETEAALRESERLYKTLFDAAEDPIGLFTLDQEIVLINRAFHTTFGYGYEEFMSFDWMELIHPEDRVKLDFKGAGFLKEGYMELDYRVKSKSGALIHISSKIVLIRGEQGEKGLILSISRDVTQSLRAMEELEEARRRAEESDKLKSAFLANMSHEIRTPMNSIVGFSNLLVNPKLDHEARMTYVSRITRNSEVLLALISDIIDLSKIESGQLPLVYGKQKLGTILKDMEQYGMDEVKRLSKKELQISTVIECDGLIETDLVRLTQIMKNLINNAIKFTDEGTVEIGCLTGADPSTVIFYVSDTGIGIDPSNAELIFDQFRQIDGSNTRKYGGTGLGLAICRNLARMMGGEIRVESGLGEGAVFKLELPLKATKRSGKDILNGIHADYEEEKEFILKILVVDDEQDSLDLFREILNNLGHEVYSASNGFEALQMLEKKVAPDLIFMDDQMPVLSGTETMKIIKERYPGIKVVVVSAHALVGDRFRFLKEGYDAYLPKPFTQEQLDDILSH